MASISEPAEVAPALQAQVRSAGPGVRPSDLIAMAEALLKRDEAEVIFVLGNLALVALELVEWPVAALALTLHAISRTRLKALKAVAEVCEEAE